MPIIFVKAYDAYQTLAASSGNVDSARLMLDYAFAPTVHEILAQSKRGERNLFVAALLCDVPLAMSLLEEEGGRAAAIVDTMSDGSTPLMAAVHGHCEEVLELLLIALGENLVAADDLAALVDATGSHGLSALTVGVLRASYRNVKLLLGAGASPNQAHAFARSTPLHMAAELGHVGIMQLLCQHGANSSAITAVGGTALHTAAQVGMDRSVSPLIRACAVPPDALLQGDTTALYLAAQHGHVATVRALLAEGVDSRFSMPVSGGAPGSSALKRFRTSLDDEVDNDATVINSQAANGATALHAAAENGHAHVVEALLAHAKNQSAAEEKYRDDDYVNDQSIGVTALHLAAQYNRHEVARVLLRHGAALDAEASLDGTSPLYHAISSRHVAMALLLLDAGADPLRSPCPAESGRWPLSRRTSPLMLALMQGDPLLPVLRDMLWRLQEKQVWMGNHKDCAGLSALHLSAGLADVRSLNLLLHHGGDLLALNSQMDTILHVIATHNRLGAARLYVKRLRSSGAVTTAEIASLVCHRKNNDGFTALHVAAGKCSRLSVLMLLLELLGGGGPSPPCSDRTDPSSPSPAEGPVVAGPLHLAASQGCVESVDVLLQAGFSAKEEFSGQSVLITAIQHNHVDVVERLLQGICVSSLMEGLPANTQPNKLSDNPLLYAVVRGVAGAVKLLLDAGAQCNLFVLLSSAPAAQPSSLLDIAQQRRYFDTAKVISLHPACSDLHGSSEDE